jgi:hypothetical protein
MAGKINYVGFDALYDLDKKKDRADQAKTERASQDQKNHAEATSPANKADLPAADLISDQQKDQISLETISRQEIISSEARKISALETISSQENISRQETISRQNRAISQEIISSLKPSSGYTKIPNTIFDNLPASLTTSEQLVFLHLYRLSHGFGKEQCLISLEKLGARTGLTGRTIQTVTASLERKGLIKKLGHNLGNGKSQGIIFSMEAISSQETISRQEVLSSQEITSTIKEDLLKKNIKKALRAYIDHFRKIKIGKSYPISELAEDVKQACARDGVSFDPVIFGDLIK